MRSSYQRWSPFLSPGSLALVCRTKPAARTRARGNTVYRQACMTAPFGEGARAARQARFCFCFTIFSHACRILCPGGRPRPVVERGGDRRLRTVVHPMKQLSATVVRMVTQAPGQTAVRVHA